MIFLTIGTQLPFDRLVQTFDEVVPHLGNEEIVGQTGYGTYRPKNFKALRIMTPSEFNATFQRARLVVGHAGIGTILTGQKFGKPLALMARRHAMGEHRNDHQMATAHQVSRMTGVHLFETGPELLHHCQHPDLAAMTTKISETRDALIAGLRQAIFASSGPGETR